MKKPKIRFKGYTEDWEQRKLGDIADIVGGGTPSTSKEEYWDGEIDWYAPAEIADQIYVDSTHVKACANSKKMRKRVAHEQALWYEEKLQKEISRDREAHGKKPLKEKDRNDPPSGGGSDNNTKEEEITEGIKTQKCSTSDPESGWFRKGEHKHVFAYAVETACDKHGWILGYSIHPGNEHDSRTFKTLYDKIKIYSPAMIIADAGYRTPAIAHELLEDGIEPLFPYKRPMTKEGFFRKYEYAYDEYYDCYICPENHILSYQTTNREGYREYVSCGEICASCPNLHRCAESKEHIKVVTRHVWEEYMEKAEDIRHTLGNKQIYDLRKETIERIFGTAKEQHGLPHPSFRQCLRYDYSSSIFWQLPMPSLKYLNIPRALVS